jgi:6-phosphogluconolactonase
MTMVGPSTFLYVGNGESRDISAFRLDEGNGCLAPIATYPVPGPSEPCYSSPLTVSPDKRILFAGLRNQPWSVCSFEIEPATGRLEYLGSGALSDNPCYISCDRTGRFLFSASYQANKIAVNKIGTGGVVGPPQQIIETLPRSHSILVDAANRYALSACLGGDSVYQWRFDAETGRLVPNEPPTVSVKAGSGPRHLVFHPNGRIVYLLNEQAFTICVYDYAPESGTLAEKQLVDALTRTPADVIWASDLHLTPNGRFLYAAERGSSTLAMLTVDPDDGTLSLTGHIATERQPRGFAIDPTGKFLYCTGQLSTRMSAYRIDPIGGTLTKLDDYPVGRNPNWIEIVPSAQ